MGDHVFISHNADDRADVIEIVFALESLRIACWIAPRDIRPGKSWPEQTERAIEDCAAFLVFVTQRSSASHYVRAETELAFSLGKPIFPIRFSAIEPPGGLRLFLQLLHWTEAFGPDRKAALERLIRELTALTRSSPDAGKARDAGSAASPPRSPSISPASPPRQGMTWLNRSRHWSILAGLALLATIILLIIQLSRWWNVTDDSYSGNDASVASDGASMSNGVADAPNGDMVGSNSMAAPLARTSPWYGTDLQTYTLAEGNRAEFPLGRWSLLEIDGSNHTNCAVWFLEFRDGGEVISRPTGNRGRWFVSEGSHYYRYMGTTYLIEMASRDRIRSSWMDESVTVRGGLSRCLSWQVPRLPEPDDPGYNEMK